MKMILVFAIATFGFEALACPNLSGSYECQDEENGSYIATVEQSSDKDGVTTYYVGETAFAVTDGVERPMEQTEEFRNGTMASSCADSLLVNRIQGDLYNDGRLAGNVEMDLQFYLGDNGDLVQRSTGEIILPDGYRHGFDQLEWCTRLAE